MHADVIMARTATIAVSTKPRIFTIFLLVFMENAGYEMNLMLILLTCKQWYCYHALCQMFIYLFIITIVLKASLSVKPNMKNDTISEKARH